MIILDLDRRELQHADLLQRALANQYCKRESERCPNCGEETDGVECAKCGFNWREWRKGAGK